MKTLNKIKLNNLSTENLSEKQMKEIRGGEADPKCFCACNYAGQGGSSTSDNLNANCAEGIWSPFPGPVGNVCY
jgi:natural product precursor